MGNGLYKTSSQSDFDLLVSFARTCQALEALEPAENRFVRSFTLDKSVIYMLPGIAIGHSRAGRRESGQVETISGVAPRRPGEILGHVNSNGDSVQDLLLHITHWLGYGYSVKAKAQLVTRPSAGRMA